MSTFDVQSHNHNRWVQSTTSTATNHIEDCKLFLPSGLNWCDHHKYCPAELVALEDHLHHAEATDTLEDICHHLHTWSFTTCFKIANVTGQINNTHSREVQHHINDKVQAAQLQYCWAWNTLMQLRGKGEWEKQLWVLEKSDVRVLNERQLMEQEKERYLSGAHARRGQYRWHRGWESGSHCSSSWWGAAWAFLDLVLRS